MYRNRSKSRRSPGDAFLDQKKIKELLSQIIAYINNLYSGSTNLKDLHCRFTSLRMNDLWLLILDNPSNFFIERENQNENGNNVSGSELIWVKTDLHLCEKHCRKDRHCSGMCGQLHLCRTFLLLGDMCCPFQKSGKVCAFGHGFDTNHNSSLLKANNLSNLLPEELRILFRRRICRSVSTMPQICIYYNGTGGKGCSNKKCKSLHLCLDYALDKCHGHCGKNHSMSNDQVAFILDWFAIDKNWPNETVLEDLRSIMKKRIRNSSDVSSVVSSDSNNDDDDDDDDEDSDTPLKGFANEASSLGKRNHKVISCCSHCKELRTEMVTMREKMNELEEQLKQLKVAGDKTECGVEPRIGDISEDEITSDGKLILGETIFPRVKRMQPLLAEKITGMILAMNKSQLLETLSSEEALKAKVEEAVEVLCDFKLTND